MKTGWHTHTQLKFYVKRTVENPPTDVNATYFTTYLSHTRLAVSTPLKNEKLEKETNEEKINEEQVKCYFYDQTSTDDPSYLRTTLHKAAFSTQVVSCLAKTTEHKQKW